MASHRMHRVLLIISFTVATAAAGLAQNPGAPQQTAVGHAPSGAPDSPLARAKELYRTGNLEGAAREYQALIQEHPDSALAYVGLVHVYLKQKRSAEAYTAADKAFALAPTLDEVRTAMGEVYFRQGKLGDAEKAFTALVRSNTSDARAHLGLSRVYRAASYFKHAKIAINHAHNLDPLDPDIAMAWSATLTTEERLKNLHLDVAIKQPEEGLRRGACRLATKPATMEMRLSPLLYDSNHLRGFGLKVGVNGASSTLMLDTGASGLLIDRKIAEKAGITSEMDAAVRGLGDKGESAGYLGYADSIKIGDLEFRDCLVHVIDKKSVIGDDGLIGADVFSQFLVEINFPDRKFKVSELPARPPEAAAQSDPPDVARFHDRYIAPEMAQFTPIYRFGHHLLIPTRVNDLAPKLFLVDTGAFGNIISPDAAKEVTKISSDTRVSVTGLSGKVDKVFKGDELTLQFANFKQRNLDIVSLETAGMSNATGTEVSGVLGFSMLGMLKIRIDYRDGLIDFEYDPNRRH